MGESVAFDPVDWITASSVGPAGARTFYVQARSGERLVALLVEKGQVQSLSELAQELLARFGVTVVPDDASVSEMELIGPITPLWRAGTMSLGTDEAGERFLLAAEELAEEPEGEPATARFVMDRDQLRKLAAFAAFSVVHGARERCQFCDGVKDPEVGCFGCPATNGHGPKRR